MRALARLAPLVAACCGCAAVLDLRDVTVEHRVGGQLRGLWDGSDGVSLRLQADGVDTLLTVSSNGPFQFPDLLAPAASYTLTVMTDPLQHTCDLDGGRNGTVTELDVTNVMVTCSGPSVTIETSPWNWNFDPTQDVQRFAGSIIMQDIAVTVAGEFLVSASVNGHEAVLGEPTYLRALPLGATTVPVKLTAHGGLSKTYHLVFDRGGAVLDQVVYGKASNADAFDHFGLRVALYGDTLVVAAYGEASVAIGPDANQQDNTAPGAGAVYVFVRHGATWMQEAYLKASNTEFADSFGSSVALYGDTLAVGADNEASAATRSNGNQQDDSAPGAGAVYVFVRSGTTWTQQAYLKASNTGAADAFGASLALYEDTLAVGADREASATTGVNGNQQDDTAPVAGAVYVFVRHGATWTQEAYLKASNAEAYDGFGSSLALYGDTLAVGAPGEDSAARGLDGNQQDNTANSAGAVYVFVRNGTTWLQQAYVKASNADVADLFGLSVALGGDTLAVGAYGEASAATGPDGDQEDNTASFAGAVYVFVRTGTRWTQRAYLKASNTEAYDGFGSSVALCGDTLAVGASAEASAATGPNGDQQDDTARGAGAVYVFVRSGAAWTQQTYLKASNTGAGDSFGAALALDGDTLAVGAPAEDSAAAGLDGSEQDNTASGAGAVYVFR
jgi:hypothetical protein